MSDNSHFLTFLFPRFSGFFYSLLYNPNVIILVIPVFVPGHPMALKALGEFPYFGASGANTTGIECIPLMAASGTTIPNVKFPRLPPTLGAVNFHTLHPLFLTNVMWLYGSAETDFFIQVQVSIFPKSKTPRERIGDYDCDTPLEVSYEKKDYESHKFGIGVLCHQKNTDFHRHE